MIAKSRRTGNLVIRERGGVRGFAVTWRSGPGRRHTIHLGSEADGWTEEAATAVSGRLIERPRPLTPGRRRAIELWVTAIDLGLADELPGMWGRLDG
jgi:hypothetical protein